MSDPAKPAVRSEDFRYLAADAVGFQFNDDVIKLIFGVDDLNNTILEQSGVMLSHATGKLLMIMLAESIKRFEQRSGREISINPAKLEEIMQIFSASDVAAAAQGQ